MNFKLIPTLLVAITMAACTSAPQPEKIQLSDGWKVQTSATTGTDWSALSETADWYDASVPSTAMAVLMENGALPADLLEGMNYKDVDRSQFDQPWWWTTEFELPAIGKDNTVRLNLDGLSYRADVWLNGQKIASADTLAGPFRRHSIDITPYINKDNRLALLVHRAQPGEPNIGFVDWNPRPADESMGVFRPVWIDITGGVSISNPAVKSKVNTETLGEAWLTIEATLTNDTDKPVSGTLKGTFDGRTVEKAVELAPKASEVVTITADDADALHIENPRLWWTHHMGTPEMYDMQLEFVADGLGVTDTENFNFGIRQIESYFSEDNARGFKLNGKPVLIRGAGWTDDIFLRNDSVRNRIEAEYVRDMGLNTIRFENVWGTSQNIYDLADELGLLVFTGWSCQWEWEGYMGTPADAFGCIKSEDDMDLIAKSFADQVSWLRNHPSIIGWFVGSDFLPRPELEQRYIDILARLDDRPFIGAAKQKHSELTGFTGTKMTGPYEYVAPNYWYDDRAAGGARGWNTETTGVGAQVPQKESAMRMFGDSIWPLGETWNYHCTSSTTDMNTLRVLKDVIAKRYGEATTLDDFMQKAEWINYDGSRTMYEAFRARVPQATGVVQWMLNSAWPAVYWQLYDHYLVPTSAYYSLKQSNAPVQLVYDYGKEEIVAVNETLESATLTATIERYGLNDAEGRKEQTEVTVEPYSVVKVFDMPDPKEIEYVFLTLSDAEGNVVAENFYVQPTRQDESDWAHSDWYVTPVKRHADLTALSALEKADVEMSTSTEGDTVTVTLTNKSPRVAFFNRLAALNADGELIAPAWWSDNFFSLRPGQTKTVTCRLPSPTTATITLTLWNQTK